MIGNRYRWTYKIVRFLFMRRIKNLEITIANAMVLNNHIINYS